MSDVPPTVDPMTSVKKTQKDSWPLLPGHGHVQYSAWKRFTVIAPEITEGAAPTCAPPKLVVLRKSSTMSPELIKKLDELPTKLPYAELQPVIHDCIDACIENYCRARNIVLTTLGLEPEDLVDYTKSHEGNSLAAVYGPFLEFVRQAREYIKPLVEFDWELLDECDQEESAEKAGSPNPVTAQATRWDALLDHDYVLMRSLRSWDMMFADELGRYETSVTHSECRCAICKPKYKVTEMKPSAEQGQQGSEGAEGDDVIEIFECVDDDEEGEPHYLENVVRIAHQAAVDAESKFDQLRTFEAPESDITKKISFGAIRMGRYNLSELKRVLGADWEFFHGIHMARWYLIEELVSNGWQLPSPSDDSE